MIRHQWNTLKIGDYVLVHDTEQNAMALIPGCVTRIETAARSNHVTIELSPEHGPKRNVTPNRLAVHLDVGDAAERCWRCETHPDVPRRSRPTPRAGMQR